MHGIAASRQRLLPLLLSILTLGCASPVAAQALRVTVPRATPPGAAVVARIATPPSTVAVSLTVFGESWPTVRVADGEWQALIGVDLDVRPGTYVALAHAVGPDDLDSQVTLSVAPKRFRRRVLRVAPAFVNPDPEQQARIASEAALIRDAYARTSTEPLWRTGFIRPVPQPANSSFGTRSVFNGQPRNPHAGTDFLSPAGTPIKAPADGQVVVARDLFFTGNTVIIDHGRGVFSMLAHLSRVDVHEGDRLDRGAIVGLVGATGRVTGPHLHWALRIGDARVDALTALTALPAER